MKILFSIFGLLATVSLPGQSDTIPPVFNLNTHYLDFVSHEIRYPREAAMNGIQGRIDCTFLVDSVGCIDSFSIVESPHETLSEAFIKALSKTKCDWTPARIDGKAVNVTLKSSFTFNLK